MPFVFVQIRPVGDKGGSWYVQRSDRFNRSTYKHLDVAFCSARNMGQSANLLVIIYNHYDRPAEAWAVQRREWRRLKLLTFQAGGTKHH